MVHELAGVHALGGDEELLVDLVLVRVAELHARQRGATSRVVDDLLHDALDVATALREVQATQLGGTLVAVRVRLEDATGSALTLGCWWEGGDGTVHDTE